MPLTEEITMDNEIAIEEMSIEAFVDHANDLHFRIGQLEGAIKGVILHLESLDPILSARSTWSISYKVEENNQVIANLKSLIGD
jgi:hypothetical protein